MATNVSVTLNDTAAERGAVALIAPLGIDTETQSLLSFRPPRGWTIDLLAEARTGQIAAVMVPDRPDAAAEIVQSFSDAGRGLAESAYGAESSPLTRAADELAVHAREIAKEAGFGRAGIAAIVEDANNRFEYGQIPVEQRWYFGRDAIPIVACAAGNCIDINTYLIAALRSCGYEAAYLTCYFAPDDPSAMESGMHCWVRTRCEGVVEDWDIAHFKKAGRRRVHATLNPVPGRRIALAHGRAHHYLWRGLSLEVTTPSVPMWVMADGRVVWPASYQVAIGAPPG